MLCYNTREPGLDLGCEIDPIFYIFFFLLHKYYPIKVTSNSNRIYKESSESIAIWSDSNFHVKDKLVQHTFNSFMLLTKSTLLYPCICTAGELYTTYKSKLLKYSLMNKWQALNYIYTRSYFDKCKQNENLFFFTNFINFSCIEKTEQVLKECMRLLD